MKVADSRRISTDDTCHDLPEKVLASVSLSLATDTSYSEAIQLGYMNLTFRDSTVHKDKISNVS